MYCKNRNPKPEPKDPTGWRFCGARGKAEWRHEAEAELRPGAFAPGWEVLGFYSSLEIVFKAGVPGLCFSFDVRFCRLSEGRPFASLAAEVPSG